LFKYEKQKARRRESWVGGWVRLSGGDWLRITFCDKAKVLPFCRSVVLESTV
jgi:hypothetical protein